MRWLALTLVLSTPVWAQDRLASMPGYDRYVKAPGEYSAAYSPASASARFSADGTGLYYRAGEKWMRYDLKKGTEIEEQPPSDAAAPQGIQGRRGQGGPQRGRQFDRATSPDGAWTASHKDRNVWLSAKDSTPPFQITTDGDEAKRTKNGIASWVYGEELGVRDAMWFSPDSTKLAFYFFDESKVKDFYLGMDQTKFQTTLDTEAYPKAGTDNPSVELRVYDVATKKTVRVESSFGNPELGHYVYSVRWSPDGSELLYNRLNRKQNHLQVCAANPTTGASRVVMEETNPKGWVDSPQIRWLADNKRFITTSERNGFVNYYLGNINGSALKPITKGLAEAAGIIKIDEKAGLMFYMARSGNTPYLFQLHRVKLDGTGEARLTNPAYNHTVSVSPNNAAFVDTYENFSTPPTTTVNDASGKVLKELARTDASKLLALGAKPIERLKFKSADGSVDCYGWLAKPANYDPNKKYPLIVDVYGGPESGEGAERFRLPDARTELGFLVAWFDGRGTSGKGRAYKDAIYGKLGVVEIDDQAAGVQALAKRGLIDANRVGIEGTSYGGYSSAMCLLRHPESFQVAIAQSAVTDWRHYDTIYTERYMGLPWENENKAGYDAGSAMTYAKDLNGHLMIYFGTADNNVHPNNSLMLAQALNRFNKGYDMMVGPDQGHTGLNGRRILEIFIDRLKPTP